MEQAGTRETDLYYIASCLIVPGPTRADPSVLMSFAIPAAWKPTVWRTEAHWTADDLDVALRFLDQIGR